MSRAILLLRITHYLLRIIFPYRPKLIQTQSYISLFTNPPSYVIILQKNAHPCHIFILRGIIVSEGG